MSVLVGASQSLDFDEDLPNERSDSLVRLVNERFYGFYVDGKLERLSPGAGPHDAGTASFSKINRVFAISKTVIKNEAGGHEMRDILRDKAKTACQFRYLHADVFTGKDRTDRLETMYALPAVVEHRGPGSSAVDAC